MIFEGVVMDLKEEHLLGDTVKTHWYYRAKLEALLRITQGLPPGGILDVGAGSGYFSRAMLERTAATAAICVDPGYPADSDETVAGKLLGFRREVAASDASLVIMMDVIEHVEDDRALVAEYVDKVASGTCFVFTVPAFMWLWSGHDVFLEHYRRYTLNQLIGVLEAAGLTVDRGHYFYGAVLPLVAGVRALKNLTQPDAAPKSDMQPYSPVVNRILFEASRLETRVMQANKLGGTTVFSRAFKP